MGEIFAKQNSEVFKASEVWAWLDGLCENHTPSGQPGMGSIVPALYRNDSQPY